jgi:two-component system chemotaxis response regulator CheY
MATKRIEEINVLVIDDEDKICELVRVFLSTAFPFNSVVSAASAFHANQKFQNQQFDLIIVDHVLPGKLGLEFIEQLRKTMKYSKVKILLMSGYLQQDDVLTAIDYGVKHILVKPFTRQQLIEKVSALLGVSEDEFDEPNIDEPDRN